MKFVIAKILKNLLGMLVTKHMIFWALELATKQSKNKIDDNVVKLVRAAYDADNAKLKEAVEALAAEYSKR